MKKIKKILVVVTIMLSVVALTGCSKKTAITSSSFNATMSEKGYKTSDITNNLSNVKVLNKAYLATDKDYKYQVEFYELKSEEDAKTMFDKNKKNIEELKGKVSTKQVSVNTNNYDKYTVVTNGRYYVIIRVANTMLYANNDATYEKEVKSIIDLLNY